MHLTEALLCVNCEAVFAGTTSLKVIDDLCPVCCSKNNLNLAKILNRSFLDKKDKPSEKTCILR